LGYFTGNFSSYLNEKTGEIIQNLPDVSDGDIIIASNLSQVMGYTEIFKGVKDLTIIESNCKNAILPPGTTFIGSCQVSQDEVEIEEYAV
jgi:hypothetical protein